MMENRNEFNMLNRKMPAETPPAGKIWQFGNNTHDAADTARKAAIRCRLTRGMSRIARRRLV